MYKLSNKLLIFQTSAIALDIALLDEELWKLEQKSEREQKDFSQAIANIQVLMLHKVLSHNIEKEIKL